MEESTILKTNKKCLVKDETDFDFNANLLTAYAEVLLGNLQRIEDTKPNYNTDASTGRVVGNPTILIGFIFKYLVGCKSDTEALKYYKEHREEMNELYAVERIIRKVKTGVIKMSPIKKLQFVLYLYYNREVDEEFIRKKFFH